MTEHVVPHFHNTPGVPVIEIGAREFMCIGGPCRRSTTRMSSSTWATPTRSSARIAQRFIATTRRSIRMPRGRRSASCGTSRRRPDTAGAARPAVTTSRTVMIAGAGIGGLTAALAIARTGFRVAIYEQAERLEEAGAGIQLSPNASRVLLALGLGDRLRPHLVTPEGLVVRRVPGGRVLARAPLGATIAQRYGAPYWVIHRADLQAALLEAVQAHPDIRLHLGVRVEDFAPYRDGVTIAGTAAGRPTEARGAALVVADGLWSRLRRRLGDNTPPRFADHIAWRALAPAENLADDLSGPTVHLWLGPNAHLVHYPVKGGRLINIVAIVRDQWADQGWNAPADRRDVLLRFAPRVWPLDTQILLAAPRRNGRNGRSTIALRCIAGAKARSRCSATPRIRCCRSSRRAARWRSKTRPCSLTASPPCRTISRAPCAATSASAAPAPRAHDEPRGRTR